MTRDLVLRPSWGLLPLRVVIGATFIAHGWLKFSSFGVAGTAQFMGGLGIPLPQVAAVCIIAIEIIGGIALILGGATRIFAALLAADMIGAIYFAKRDAGFFSPKGWELELALCTACITLALIGAGGASIDAAFRSRRATGRDAVG